jgi:hypothetical protein
MTLERCRGLDQRIPCEPFTEIAQQDPRDSRSTAAARSQLRNVQRSPSRFGTKGRVHSQAFADRVEGFTVALRRQEPINKLLSEAIGVAGIGPRNHAIPDPAVVLDCVTA